MGSKGSEKNNAGKKIQLPRQSKEDAIRKMIGNDPKKAAELLREILKERQ